VLGIGLASLFRDWSHEMATTVMPAFLATMGVAAFWVGLIEGVSDGLSSFAKLVSGYYTNQLRRRKPVAVIGYLVTASFGLATAAWHVLAARAGAQRESQRRVRVARRRGLPGATGQTEAVPGFSEWLELPRFREGLPGHPARHVRVIERGSRGGWRRRSRW
jgi:hypothetical protein